MLLPLHAPVRAQLDSCARAHYTRAPCCQPACRHQGRGAGVMWQGDRGMASHIMTICAAQRAAAVCAHPCMPAAALKQAQNSTL